MQEETVRIPTPDGVTLEGTLLTDEALPVAENVVVPGQVHPETREAVLARGRRMLRQYSAQYKCAILCFDYRGHGGSTGRPDPGAVKADRAAVVAFLQSRLQPAVQVQFWGYPEPRRARVRWVQIPPGAALPLYCYPATGPSRGTVLFASSSPAWEELHDALAVRLVEAGYAVVGVSSLDVPERIWGVTGEPVTVEQFLAAYEVLWPRAQEQAGDERPMLLLGHSAGSSGNLLLAAHAGSGPEARPGLAGRVRGIVGYGNSGNKGFSLGFEGLVDHEVWRLEPYLRRVQVPAFLVQGDADFIPPAEIEPLVALLGERNHWRVIPGADHDFTGRFEEVAALVLEGLRFVGE